MPHISKCFNRSIVQIKEQVDKLQDIQRVIINYIPKDMQNICKISSFHNGCLVLTVEDSIWASQIRFLIPEIRDNLRKNHNFYELSSIKIMINRETIRSNATKTNQSNQTLSPWKKILESLTTNEKI